MADRFGNDSFNIGISPMRLEQPDAVQIMRSSTTSRHFRLNDNSDASHEHNRRGAQRIEGSMHAHCDPEFDPSL